MAKKILMLHGYLQSDRIFKAKTGGLRKALGKLGYELFYPCAPQFVALKDIQTENAEEDLSKKYSTSDSEDKLYGWWVKKGSAITVTADYEIPTDTIKFLHDYIVANGPFEGIMGFSQGAGIAGYLCTNLHQILNLTNEVQPNFKFLVSFCGFKLEPENYQRLYETNPIAIPSLHIKGEMDTLVTEERSSQLVNACPENLRAILVHPGGHFVPNSKQFVAQICAWVQAQSFPTGTLLPGNDKLTSKVSRNIANKTTSLEKPDIDDDLMNMIDSIGKI